MAAVSKRLAQKSKRAKAVRRKPRKAVEEAPRVIIPHEEPRLAFPGNSVAQPGMTLREYYAGQALPACIRAVGSLTVSGARDAANAAAYYADTLIATLNRRGPA